MTFSVKNFSIRLIFGLLVFSLIFNPTDLYAAKKKAKQPAKSNKQVTKPVVPDFPPNKYAALILEVSSGKVILEEKASEQRYPASLTKMMTLYLLFDSLKQKKLNLNSPLTVSERAAAADPTKLGLKAGETITVEEAILGLVTKSANDASVVVAEALGGTVEQFAVQMTEKAKKLGMAHTVFKNPHGLPDAGQITTAHDLGLLARALILNHPDYYPYFSQEQFVFRGTPIRNHNKLLGKIEGLDGLKTGYIRDSGFNLAASAQRDNQRVVVVVMGGISSTVRNEKVAKFIELGFERLKQKQTPAAEGQTANTSHTAAAHPIQNILEAPNRSLVNAKRQGPGEWGLQIGAYSNTAKAEEMMSKPLKDLQTLNPQAYALITPSKGKNKTLYQAQILGLDDKTVQNAYAQLKHQGFDPMILLPQTVATRLAQSPTNNK